jgi:ferredoxin-NADP reductase
MTTGSLALIIFFAILAQAVVAALVWLHRRKRQLRRLECGADQAQTSPRLESSKTRLAWEGFKEFVVKRRVMEDRAASVCSFYLTPADGEPLPPFKPGQYLTFKLPISDAPSGQTKTVVRCYSLSDRPRPDCYRVSIKRVAPPHDKPGVPPGLSSNYFHDHVKEGSRLLVRAPSGHFHLMEHESLPIVLVAGGIGITPMLSIINTVLESGGRRHVSLYYGVRKGTEHVMKDHFRVLAEAHPNFHLHTCYSKPGSSDVESVDYQHRGHVNLPLLRATLQLARYQFYVCGPKPMMESVVPGLEDWGVDSGDLHYEYFGPAPLIRREKLAADVQPITVTFSESGKRIAWKSSADSLLTFAEANGIEVESGCRAGSCGSCQTHIDAGEVELNQQPDADVEPGYCLLCISVPKGDLTLAA